MAVSGATVIPGLIDTHVHLASVPGAEVREDLPPRRRALREQHLRAYLACGVTTVLDAGTDVATAREVRSWLAAGRRGPAVLTLQARVSRVAADHDVRAGLVQAPRSAKRTVKDGVARTPAEWMHADPRAGAPAPGVSRIS